VSRHRALARSRIWTPRRLDREAPASSVVTLKALPGGSPFPSGEGGKGGWGEGLPPAGGLPGGVPRNPSDCGLTLSPSDVWCICWSSDVLPHSGWIGSLSLM
jgi:hypothetical protein